MKKSILMAIVALALLAAPAFAGDYSIVGNIDWGFGFGLGASTTRDVAASVAHSWVFGDDDNDVLTPDVWYDPATPVPAHEEAVRTYNVSNDYTQLGFYGAIDANNSLSITTEYGSSGGGGYIDGALNVQVTDFNLTTNILGALGVADVPVTLFMSAGHGRLNLHNRFQQWTGWEIKRWKDNGAAHLESVWNRENYLKFTVGIMNMVNVSFGMCPYFTRQVQNVDGDFVTDVPVMLDVWTTGISVGPAALDIAANLRASNLEMRLGAQVTANMNFGALGLMAFVGDDLMIDRDGADDADMVAMDNAIYVAVKPSYNFGAGTVALGVWFGLTTTILDDNADFGGVMADPADVLDPENLTQMDLAVDVSVTFSTFTIYGGVLMTDLSDRDEDDEKPMKWDLGVKNAFGAATVGLGVTGIAGTEDGTGTVIDNQDIGAADGTGINWLNDDGNAVPTLYFRVSAWY